MAIKVVNENFSQNVVTFHFLLVDRSGSMEGKKEVSVRNGLKIIKDNLMTLEDISSTRVCKIEFGSHVYESNLVTVEDFSTNYYARSESTHLYDAICYVKEQIEKLVNIYREKYRLNINVIVLSDGEDYGSNVGRTSAKSAVDTLKNKLKTSAIFYAIEEENGMDKLTRKARELGFDVKRVENTPEAIRRMSIHASQMLHSSSKNGVIATLTPEISVSVSGLAPKEFQQHMAEVEIESVDPFEGIF